MSTIRGNILISSLFLEACVTSEWLEITLKGLKPKNSETVMTQSFPLSCGEIADSSSY